MTRLIAYISIPCALALAPLAAAADPGQQTLFGQPVQAAPELTEEEIAERRAAFEKYLDDNDLIHAGGLVVPRSMAEDDLQAGPRPTYAWDTPPKRHTVFLNFFGGEMTGGTNSALMESPCIQGGKVQYPQFLRSEQEALAIIQVFQDAMTPFGVRIAYEKAPPKHLPYSMVMMGGKPGVIGLPNGVLGVACNLDCGDTWWRDTTFAFTEVAGDIQVLGTTALQEAAHAWGLDHIDGEDNIMYPYATFGKKVWADTCTPYNAATGPIGCEYVHDEFCGENGGAQNDVAELMAFFGANSVDDVPPTVTLLSPADGAVIEPGTDVLVEAEISDNFEGYGWRMMIPEADIEAPAYSGEKEWSIKPPKGTYTIRVEALDHDGNIGFAEAVIHVGVEPADPTTGEPTTGDTSDTGDTTDGPSSETDTEGNVSGGSNGTSATATATSPLDPGGDESGCNCVTAPVSRDMSVWMFALAGLGLVRRRRS
ncbi:MYXO-CTERM sorting domain-containing protein [Nannocystis bainbridge]|uniref:MYXO-CTERM sorting domain-containing protein n=1 Tax=Nannocystis bainbridge TaxID=2995303 RepID=A0ABT5DP24_9BACT|nr:MYXO-CTERM sorting domain-containing protein [Nannocystis bainbridge]MDC0715410.1 MYXO-CTERM sorting domain-containing protein [Nannocystis bainbridge]